MIFKIFLIFFIFKIQSNQNQLIQLITDQNIHTHIKFNFQFQTLQSSKHNWFVLYFAPWCHHCKIVLPIWRQLALKVKVKNYDLKIGAVNCEISDKLCSRFNVQKYPTLLYLTNQGIYEYEHGNVLDEFLDYALQEYKGQEKISLKNVSMGDKLIKFMRSLGMINLIVISIFLIGIIYCSISTLCFSNPQTQDQSPIQNQSKQTQSQSKTQ